jgi:hypothetical protein
MTRKILNSELRVLQSSLFEIPLPDWFGSASLAGTFHEKSVRLIYFGAAILWN